MTSVSRLLALPATFLLTIAPHLSSAETPPPAMAMQTPEQLPAQTAERTSINSVHVDQPVIAMTFDDGPNPTFTPLCSPGLPKAAAARSSCAP